MKNIYFLLIFLSCFSCKEKKDIPQKFKTKDLDFITRFILSSGYIERQDHKPLKMESVIKISESDETIYKNLKKEKFFDGDILIAEEFHGNTISNKPYSLDENGDIIFLYDDFNVKLQRKNENFEIEKRLPNKKHGEVLLKDLDDDGIKEIIVYQKEGTYDYTYQNIDVYSVFE